MTREEEKTANKLTLAAERQRYMDGQITHDEYYIWLSDWIGLRDNLIPATSTEVRASKDPHLNDVQLSRWDQMDYAVRQHANTKGIPWSLSDTVCCLKAMAKRRRERESQQTAT